MKNIPAPLRDAFAGTSVSKCRILTMALPNGTTYRLTDLDAPVLFGGNLYLPAFIDVTAIRNTLNSGVADATITLLLAEGTPFREAGVRRGQLDGFGFQLQAIDWRNPQYGAEVLLFGIVGDIEWTNSGRCELMVQGLSGQANLNIGEIFSQECRNRFGDNQCRYPVQDTKVVFTVGNADGTNMNFASDQCAAPVDVFWNYGLVTWTAGDNMGLSMEVQASEASGIVSLALPMPYDIKVGDQGEIVRGCSKALAQCVADYGNAINYRGEPDVPTATGQQIVIAAPDLPPAVPVKATSTDSFARTQY